MSIRKKITAIAVSVSLALSSVQGFAGTSTSAATSQNSCKGRFFNPLSDPNWNDLFPITIFGVNIIGGAQPPIIHEPPICFCPSDFFGMTLPGIGITYWEPLYVAEVSSSPGCLITVGGVNAFGGGSSSGFGNLFGPKVGSLATDSSTSSHEQVHWYVYPIIGIIDAALTTFCKNSSQGFDLAGMTEIDPLWQNDIWANVFTPESGIFATPPMQAACLVDAVASSIAFPVDPLFWCAGAWGTVYPMSANPNSVQSDQQANAMTLAKYIAFEARTGMLLTTVGPGAICSSTYSPIWIKSQFRIDPIYPFPNYSSAIYIGQSQLRWGYIPPANFPTQQDSAYLIWNAEQCCLRF